MPIVRYNTVCGEPWTVFRELTVLWEKYVKSSIL